MPRGAPDYSNVTAAIPTHRVDDMGEIATRLWSPVTYDRGGSVVFLSQFGRGISQFKRKVVGTGASQVASTDVWLTEGFSLKMTTSNANDEISDAVITVAIPESDTKMGFESAFSIVDSEVGVAIQVSVFQNLKLYQYTLVYRTDLDRLYISSPTGDGILESDLILREESTAWHKWKLVVDLESRMYVRAMLDERRYDISEYEAFSYPTGEENSIDIGLQAWSRDNTNRIVYWENMIVTQGEP